MSIAASSPAQADDRSKALEGRCQSLVREAVKEDRPRRRASGRRPLRGDFNRGSFSPAPAGDRPEACVPSPVSGFRTPNLLLLPVWEKGGDEGRKRAGMQQTVHLSQELDL